MDLKSKQILIVEDCADTRQMIKYALKHSGYKSITEATDGKQALALLQKQKFDLVITDWRMPNMDGITFFNSACQAGLHNTPFLMLTAESSRENVLEALDAGVSDYLLKPFTLNLLATKVERLLED